ncbi:hypothetical protein FQN54_008479 [Arachnomyces sp. PD_36]|nr:hypothetical protein FQN54_008479 [Arachnomyces sp. PD_36]
MAGLKLFFSRSNSRPPPSRISYRQSVSVIATPEYSIGYRSDRHAPKFHDQARFLRFFSPVEELASIHRVMNIWLRAGLTRYIGRRLRISREPHNSELLGLAPFHPYIFGPAHRSSSQWKRSSSTGSGEGDPQRRRNPPKFHPTTIPPIRFRDDPRAWVSFLEPYIPRPWRKETTRIAKPEASEKEHCETILHILRQARSLADIDLLTFLGIELNRWEAVHAVIRMLIENAENTASTPKRTQLPSNLDWGAMGSFEYASGPYNIRGAPSTTDNGYPALSALDAYTEGPQMSGQMGEGGKDLGAMGEVWQTLGSIILDASDLPRGKSRLAMSCVYRIIAHLHHVDLIPNEVYNYVPTHGQSALHRPPAMQILSSHIMNVLTDAVWQATETEIAGKAAAEGSKFAPSAYKMGVRELGHGIWLEFVLWCCVEGGFVNEGIGILERMKARESGKAWSVRSWASLQLDAESIHPSSVDRDHVWGESVKFPDMESSQSDDPFQGLGEKTICSEVVSSLMDGLINTVRVGVGFRGNAPNFVRNRIAVLRSMLDENSAPTTSGSLTQVLRIFETGGIIPEVEPQSLEHILRLAPPASPHQGGYYSSSRDAESNPPAMEAIADHSAVIPGMYRYLLDIYAYGGNAGGAFNTFQDILDQVGAAKPHNKSEERQRLHSSTTHINESSSPLLPNVSLSHILDLATTAKAYTLGKRLVSSTDAGDPIIPTSSHGDPVLAPAIIRFAAATMDRNVLDSVTKRLTVPLPNNVIKSILNYKIAANEWVGVSRLLEHLRDGKNGHWGVTNAASLAAAIVSLEKQPHSESQRRSLATAKAILVRLLEGRYNRPQNPAEAKYTYQEETIFQLHRIFLSIPGSLSDTCRDIKLEWVPSGRQMIRNIPNMAFCYLLSAVVDNYGSAEGRRLWDTFCIDPNSPEARRILTGGVSLLYTSSERIRVEGNTAPPVDHEWIEAQRTKFVTPDLRSVRIIAQRAVLENRKFELERELGIQPGGDGADIGVTPEDVESVLVWCIMTFRKLRLRDAEIDRELDGFLASWKQRTPRRVNASQTY